MTAMYDRKYPVVHISLKKLADFAYFVTVCSKNHENTFPILKNALEISHFAMPPPRDAAEKFHHGCTTAFFNM